MNVLVTGGAGFIGSHTAVALLDAGHDVALLDNLCGSSAGAVTAVRELAGRDVAFRRGDIADAAFVDAVLEEGAFDAVMHFAAFKAVAESVADPLAYYQNNVAGTVCLLQRMAAHDLRAIVFSSSATVYGEPATTPIDEGFPVRPVNPYGRTKAIVERMLRDLHAADARWRVSILRYFNPVGAHPSGVIGEAPRGVPNNLLPYIAQVATGLRARLDVFGDDYATPDGTCVRDYIHVVDLAEGHVRALEHVAAKPAFAIHNLGTGQGHSVLEVVDAFKTASGRPIPFRVVGRRPGDIPVSFADVARAEEDLGWKARYDLARMCEHMWHWQLRHPNGYDEPSDA